VVWISSNTPASDTQIAIGVGTAAVNGTEQTVANESTAPSGVTFSEGDIILVKPGRPCDRSLNGGPSASRDHGKAVQGHSVPIAGAGEARHEAR
jgi:hypothetical protein